MKQENAVQKTLDLFVTRASDWYYFNEEVRKYHNIQHAFNVVRGVWELCGVLNMTEPPSPALLLAAFWHDAVYVPGAGARC